MNARYLTALFVLLAMPGCTDPLNEQCQELSKKHVEFAKTSWKQDYTVIKAEGFYSKKLDACIHTEIAAVGVKAEIRDLSRSVMRDGGHRNLLLNCDPDGADSVRLDKMKQYQGLVFNVPYSEWLDDGFGGPPRAIKTPTSPYTKEQCRKVFDKWITDLKTQ